MHLVHSDPSNLALLPVTNSPLDSAIKYLNGCGFTYVGIYRERFTTSSRKAMEVFETKEWIGVVNDKLIPTMLNLIAAAITIGSSCFGLVVEEFDGYRFTNVKKLTSTAFIIGCTIGLVVSTMCLKVVGSSGKILVLYLENLKNDHNLHIYGGISIPTTPLLESAWKAVAE